MKLIFITALFWISIANVGVVAQGTGAPDIAAAKRARDTGSIQDLRKIIEKTKAAIGKKKSLAAYLRLAEYHVWLCEAIEVNDDDKLFKQVAQDGIAAAEKAVALGPGSSEAHYLLGDLLNQLIPHVYGGGMRYGKRAEDALEKSLRLDPRNTRALVSRAISYYYTPESFGGSKAKAFELLEKARKLRPAEDDPHIWLAMFYSDSRKQAEAIAAISAAMTINPNRRFTNFVHDMIKKGGMSKTSSPEQ